MYFQFVKMICNVVEDTKEQKLQETRARRETMGSPFPKIIENQRAKKVVSDSPGPVDFAIGLVNSVLNLPDGQAKIFQRIKITKVL